MSWKHVTAVFVVGTFCSEVGAGTCISAHEQTEKIPARHCDAAQPHNETEPQAPTRDQNRITFATSAESINTSLSVLAVYKKMISNTGGNEGKTFLLG